MSTFSGPIPRLPRRVSPDTIAESFINLASIRSPTVGNIEEITRKLGIDECPYHARAVIQQFRDAVPDMPMRFWDPEEKNAIKQRQKILNTIKEYLEEIEGEIELLELEIEEAEEAAFEQEIEELLADDNDED